MLALYDASLLKLIRPFSPVQLASPRRANFFFVVMDANRKSYLPLEYMHP